MRISRRSSRPGKKLLAVRKKIKALSDPVLEEQVIRALNDIDGLWELMFPGTKSELLRMVLGKILVFPEQIFFVLKVEDLKDLAEEMAVSGFFKMPHETDPDEYPRQSRKFWRTVRSS